MTDRPVLMQVQALIAEALQVPAVQITPDLSIGGIKEWDSMGHMSVMMLLEEKLGINIDAETIGTLTSIPVICAYVEKGVKE